MANPQENNTTSNNNDPNPDPWTATAYQASSSFVPSLTTRVLSWLSPQPHERILDLGCGDGILTAKIAPLCASILGLDGSANLIAAARENFGDMQGGRVEWEVKDCRYLDSLNPSEENRFHKIFSNAALHWILHDPSTRQSVLEHCFRLLHPNGTLVFEMGGAGNVAEVHTALIASLVHVGGVSIEAAREACPWFFPSEELMRGMLVKAGFVVERAEVQYRPTRLMEGEGGGLEGWVKLHGDSFLRVVKGEERREEVVREVVRVLEGVITREKGEGDEGVWIGYVRLRVLARKPA